MKRAKKPWVMNKTRMFMRRKIWDRIGSEKVLIPRVLERISCMYISFGFIFIRENNNLAALFSDHVRKYGVPEQIYYAIKEELCEIGVRSFGELVIEYCDHVNSPEALAFALECNVFSSSEVKFIERRLDHGETLQEFRGRSERLMSRVISELQKIHKKEKPKTPSISGHKQVTCADGGPCCV